MENGNLKSDGMTKRETPWQKMMNRSQNLDDVDFFPTPAEPTIALMRWVNQQGIRLSDTIWEPACGDGAISEVIETFDTSLRWPGQKYETFNTDLKQYGYEKQDNQFDFLKKDLYGSKYDFRFDIITNPPYSYHREFIKQALLLARRYVIMLFPLTYMTPQNKRDLYQEYCKVTFLPLGFRPGFIMPGRTKPSKMKDYMWVMWDKREALSPRHDLYFLPNPEA